MGKISQTKRGILMDLKVKASSITEKGLRVVTEQRVVMGTALKPDTHVEWQKEEAVTQYTTYLLAKIFKGRVKTVRNYTEDSFVTGGYQQNVYKFTEHTLEVGSVNYLLAVKNSPGCQYRFNIHITDLKTGKIYNFGIKNGDVYYKQQKVGNSPEAISKVVLAEDSIK